jgi:hypothetical protein
MPGAVSTGGDGEGDFDPLGYITASRRGEHAAGWPTESRDGAPSDPNGDDGGQE